MQKGHCNMLSLLSLYKKINQIFSARNEIGQLPSYFITHVKEL